MGYQSAYGNIASPGASYTINPQSFGPYAGNVVLPTTGGQYNPLTQFDPFSTNIPTSSGSGINGLDQAMSSSAGASVSRNNSNVIQTGKMPITIGGIVSGLFGNVPGGVGAGQSVSSHFVITGILVLLGVGMVYAVFRQTSVAA